MAAKTQERKISRQEKEAMSRIWRVEMREGLKVEGTIYSIYSTYISDIIYSYISMVYLGTKKRDDATTHYNCHVAPQFLTLVYNTQLSDVISHVLSFVVPVVKAGHTQERVT